MRAQVRPQRVFAAISVNAVDQGEHLILIGDNDVSISRDDVDALGLTKVVDAMRPQTQGPFISLNALKPVLTYVFDPQKVTLAITVQPQYLTASSFSLPSATNAGVSRSRSAFLDYGLLLAQDQKAVFSPQIGSTLGAGVASATFNQVDNVYRATNVNWTVQDTKKLSQFIAGDAYVDLGDLGGSSVYRGLTFDRNFGLNPYFSRLTSRTLTGYVSAPATADVYANGQLVSQIQLPPGAFNISNLPLQGGLNNAQVVIHDALGNVQTVSQSYYEGVGVLPRGVSDYDYSAGEPQDGQGLSTGPFSVAGRYSRGLNDIVTAGGRIEASRNLLNAGPTLALQTRYGEFDVIAIASSSAGARGYAGEAIYSYTSRALGLNFGWQFQSPQYANVSLAPSADRTLSNFTAGLSFPILHQSLSLSFNRSDDRDQGVLAGLGAQTVFRLSHQLSLSFDYERQWGYNGKRTDVLTQLLLPLGRAGDTIASLTHDTSTAGGSTTLSAQRSARPDQPLGFNVLATRGSSASETLLQAVYDSAFSTLSVQDTRLNGSSIAEMNVAGAIVYADGHLLPSRPVTQSFAVVDTGGLAGLPVYVNSVNVGTTNRAGLLAVPDIIPFAQNSISIDTANQPLDLTFSPAEQKVTPAYLTASVVHFKAQKTQSFLGSIVMLVGGKPQVPKYGVLTISLPNGKTATTELGDNGEFYFSNLPAGAHPASVQYAETNCNFTVAIPDTTNYYVKLGKLTCTANASPSPQH